jgi:hypothetical protein
MTNKVVLRAVDEFMADYVPVYQPIYPLFMGKAQSYSEEVGKLTFKRLEAVGDIRGKHITPKDTEIRQIGVKESSKVFKKYFLANQFVQSALQEQSRTEDVIAQVLDEHQKQMDELFLLGEGTSNSTMINNGLFWSGDSNYTLENSATVDGDGVDPLIDLHAKVLQSAEAADQISGRKVIMFYGSTILPYFDGVYAASSMPFKKILGEVLGSNYSLLKMPSAVTPNSANGWIVANLDQVKLHYTALPQLKDQGVNSEKMYSWHNFLMGSCMLEVLASGGIIRQPATVDLGA